MSAGKSRKRACLCFAAASASWASFAHFPPPHHLSLPPWLCWHSAPKIYSSCSALPCWSLPLPPVPGVGSVGDIGVCCLKALHQFMGHSSGTRWHRPNDRSLHTWMRCTRSIDLTAVSLLGGILSPHCTRHCAFVHAQQTHLLCAAHATPSCLRSICCLRRLGAGHVCTSRGRRSTLAVTGHVEHAQQQKCKHWVRCASEADRDRARQFLGQIHPLLQQLVRIVLFSLWDTRDVYADSAARLLLAHGLNFATVYEMGPSATGSANLNAKLEREWCSRNQADSTSPWLRRALSAALLSGALAGEETDPWGRCNDGGAATMRSSNRFLTLVQINLNSFQKIGQIYALHFETNIFF